MSIDRVRDALESLREERDRLDSAIAALEQAIGEPTRSVGRPRGRKPAGAGTSRVASTGSRKAKRAPRGLLKKTIHEILRSARKPFSGAELRDAVAKTGYPSANAKNLYASVFISASNDSAIKKTKEGFALRGRGTAAGPKTKTAKKKAPKRTKAGSRKKAS